MKGWLLDALKMLPNCHPPNAMLTASPRRVKLPVRMWNKGYRRLYDAAGRIAGTVILTWTAAAGAQTTVAPVNLNEIVAVRATKPPVIDGAIEEEEWKGAAVITGFIQYEPRRGEPSDLRTDALVLYDAGHIYVAFRSWDAEAITAQLTQRDTDLFTDDAVAVVLDTTFDRRSGYYFITNALGTQADGRIADDGRLLESSWDAPWQSAARRTDYGWSAEFSLPLSSIRYAAGKSQVWGINFGRSRRRTLERSFWTGPLDNQWRVSQAGRLTALDVPPPLDRIQIVPFALTRLQDNMAAHWEGGVDARYTLTPTTAVYATLFPDFATIEADQEQINLTRFELTLPEKRQFFLEGQEQFNQRFRTFYSRRIEDIRAGGKLLGKQGPWTMVFLSADSRPTGGGPRANYSVARAQRDVSGRSTVAIMGANRRLEGRDQGSVSTDANLYFTRTFSMTAQAVKSYGPFGHGTWLHFLRPSYDSPTGHIHLRYGHIGDRVADNLNVIGQIVDDDRRELDSHVTKIRWIRRGAFEKLQHDANYNIYWGQTGILRSWKVNESLDTEFRNRVSTEFSWIEEYKLFEKKFRNREVGFDLGYNTREYESVKTGIHFGRNFDADFKLWTAAARHKITPKLSAEYSFQRLTLDPDLRRESTWIHVLRADQFFTKDLFLRLFFQTNSAIERNNIQALFVYRYLPPFGTIQVAYQRGTAAFGQRSSQGNTLFLKATTVF